MRYYIVIPAFNEEKFLAQTLESIVIQTHLPARVVVVNDNSTDGTEAIIDNFTDRYPYIIKHNNQSQPSHASGAKVVRAFLAGLNELDKQYDFIVKLDADIILPAHYFEILTTKFSANRKLGIAGGFAYERNKNGDWILQHPMNKDHVRGGFKSYSKLCYEAIGGLKPSIGWDTVDELLARFHGFEIETYDELAVKHLRPLGSSYSRKSWESQGEALYRMRYGPTLATIASLKMAFKHRKFRILRDNYKGYKKARKNRVQQLVSPEEGKFIRRYRWHNIAAKLS